MNSTKRNSNIRALIKTVLNYLLSVLFSHLTPLSQKRKPCLLSEVEAQAYGIFVLLSFNQGFSQSINDRYQNHANDYILKQQGQIFTPILTPQGFVEGPVITNLTSFLYTNTDAVQISGSNAQKVIQDQQKNNAQFMGLPHIPTEKEKTFDYYDKQSLARQLKEQELYNEINKIDEYAKADEAHQKEIEAIKKKLRLADTISNEYKSYLKYYEKTYADILQMLTGKIPIDLKRAVFLVENPYYQNKLNYTNYCKQIDSLVFICKQIMADNNLSSKNYMACHYAIQKLFSEKVTYKNTQGKTTIFEPLVYDLSIYDDGWDIKDHTEQFVTKLLNIKMGQCHSMPLLYLILANELNINAYLALAPNHSYIKFGNPKQAYCFETTNGTFTSDQWIVSSGYISATAIKNQIYLAPLSTQQVLAQCLTDLEAGLEERCGKSMFSIKCANTTLEFNSNSIKAVLTIHNFINAECAHTAKKYHFPKYEDYHKYPELKQQFDKLLDYELKVEGTGYQKITPEQYEEWRKSANSEKEKREHLKLKNSLQQSANEK